MRQPASSLKQICKVLSSDTWMILIYRSRKHLLQNIQKNIKKYYILERGARIFKESKPPNLQRVVFEHQAGVPKSSTIQAPSEHLSSPYKQRGFGRQRRQLLTASNAASVVIPRSIVEYPKGMRLNLMRRSEKV